MMILHTLPGTDELESLSPFCMKVEVYLKLTGTPYEAKPSDPRRAPKRKLPYVVDDGAAIADSGFVIEHLEKKAGERALDHGISAMDAARGHAIRRMLEESTYFALLWTRWIEDTGWAFTKHFFDGFPAPLRLFVPGMIRGKIRQQIYAQGVGRHEPKDIHAWAKKDLDALATLIGDGPYVLGDRVRTVDATAYAFLANCALQPVDLVTKAHVRGDARLMGYVERIRDELRRKRAA